MSARLLAAACSLAACLFASAAHAGNPCVLSSGGMGGTGAPAAMEGEGIGGTGRPAATADMEGGMGGTGATAGRDPGGMGGTGSVADEGGIGGTGIVGVITGFGSVCVGGVEIHYGPSTPISSDGHPMKATQLKIGHVVQVRARGLGDSVHAQSIELVHAVTGPVRAVNAKAGRLEVLGQQVRASAAVIAQAQAAQRAGHPVEVSGLRARNGEIVATRVDAAPHLKEFGVLGPVRALSGGSARIGDLTIKLNAVQSRDLRPGQSVEICGPLEGGTLRARTIETKGASALKGRVERLVIEGFVSERSADRLQVGDTAISVSDKTRIVSGGDPQVDQRVVVAARQVDGKLVAESVEHVRDRGHSDAGTKKESGGEEDDSQSQKDTDKDADKDGKDAEKDAERAAEKDLEEDARQNRDDDKDKDQDKDADKAREKASDRDRQDERGGKDDTKLDSTHGGGGSDGGASDRRAGTASSDIRKDNTKDRNDRTRPDKERDSGRDANRPPREPKPERPSGSSSHGGRPERVRVR